MLHPGSNRPVSTEDMLRKLAKKQKLVKTFYCRECGVPLLLGKLAYWHPGGAIVAKNVGENYRFAFLEQDLIYLIVDLLGQEYGEARVQQILYDVERSASGQFAKAVFKRGRQSPVQEGLSYILRKTNFINNWILKQSTFAMGVGSTDTVIIKRPWDKHPDKTIVSAVLARNPHHEILIQADADGIGEQIMGEFLENAVLTLSKQEHIYLFMNYAGRAPKERKEYSFEERKILIPENPEKYLCCTKCGVPRPISYFYWDARLGIIINRKSGKRVVFWPCYSLENPFLVFEEEFGIEAQKLIFQAIKDYQKKSISSAGVGLTDEEAVEFINLEGDTAGRAQLLLHRLAYLGFGSSTLTMNGKKATVEITNPLVPQIVAGLFTGIFEALTDTPYDVCWSGDLTKMTYTLTPEKKKREKH